MLLVNDYKHEAWSFQGSTGSWQQLPLYQGKIFEQEGVCRDSSTSLHVDRATEAISINIDPVPDTGIMQGNWDDACSKMSAGQCSWFHTGQDLSWLNITNGEGYYGTDNLVINNGGGDTYPWPDLQDFAYRVCKAPGSSSNCHTNGDLQLSKICSSSSIGDVDYSLVNDDFRHRFSQQAGSYVWPQLYQGSLSSAAVWSRKEGGDFSSSGGTLDSLAGGGVGNFDNNGEILSDL